MQSFFKKNGFLALIGARSVIKSPNFPAKFEPKSSFKYSYILGIGGNIGDVRIRFERLYRALCRDARFFVYETSQILKNKAFGYLAQDDFLNAVICTQSALAPRQMLKIMQRFELKFGRKRSFKNAPRTLDIDILYANVKVRHDKRLILPHPGASERVSVVFPLGGMSLEKGLL